MGDGGVVGATGNNGAVYALYHGREGSTFGPGVLLSAILFVIFSVFFVVLLSVLLRAFSFPIPAPWGSAARAAASDDAGREASGGGNMMVAESGRPGRAELLAKKAAQ